MEKIICKCKNVDFGEYTRTVSMFAPFKVRRSTGEFKDTIAPDGSVGTWICVDICLATEIAELWNLGIETTGCCCGHNKGFAYIGVLDKYIDKMLELGYKIAPGITPDRRDSFYPLSMYKYE